MVISDDFMVIARLESLIAGAGLEDALERAEQYIQAGADGLMIHSSNRRPDDILAFAEAYEALCRRMGCRPVLVSVPTTTVSDAELVPCGFNVIIHANHLLRAAYKSKNQAARTILESGRSLEVDPLCAPVGEIFATVGLDRINRKDRERAEDMRLVENRRNGAALAPEYRR
jgi:phosphoenolpyruvate phosphomutase